MWAVPTLPDAYGHYGLLITHLIWISSEQESWQAEAGKILENLFFRLPVFRFSFVAIALLNRAANSVTASCENWL